MRVARVIISLGFIVQAFSSQAAWSSDELVAEGAELETLATGFGTVEGPVMGPDGTLYFTDIPNEHLWQLDPLSLGRTLFRQQTEGANGLAFDREGRLLMCKGKGRRLARLEANGEETVLLEPVREIPGQPKRAVGVNDVVLDRAGQIYVTVPGAGAVFALSADGRDARPVVTALKGPNGLMLSPDEKRLYVSEYKEQKIHVYDLDVSSRTASNGRLFAAVEEPSDYGCDGMTTDDQGNLYCAGPHAVRVWNPEGDLIGEIPIPESPTNCAYAGAGSSVLYITGRQSVFRLRMKRTGVR